MKLLVENQRAFTVMASPLRLRSIARKACLRCYSSSALKWVGGVSMVQGASRGIGLVFVSFLYFLFHFLLYWSTTFLYKKFTYHFNIDCSSEILNFDGILLMLHPANANQSKVGN